MKKLLRLLAVCLTCVLGIVMLCACDGADLQLEKEYKATESSYFVFEALEDGTYSVAAAENVDMPEKIALPQTYNDVAVTAIKAYGFDSLNITSVTIPKSITTIGNGAFNACSQLSEVDIRDGVVVIGSRAFANCSKLLAINLPTSVEKIEAAAFISSALCSVKIADSITAIGDDCFKNCSALAVVQIGIGLNTIGNDAFLGCASGIKFYVADGNTVFDSVNGELLTK